MTCQLSKSQFFQAKAISFFGSSLMQLQAKQSCTTTQEKHHEQGVTLQSLRNLCTRQLSRRLCMALHLSCRALSLLTLPIQKGILLGALGLLHEISRHSQLYSTVHFGM